MVLAMLLLLAGVMSRLLPHAPNFSPVVAIALFGGVYLRRPAAWWMPLALMVLSDLLIGLHDTVLFTWGSVLFISLGGGWLRRAMTPFRVVAGALGAAVFFFLVTNLGAWFVYYPHTAEGLVTCFTLAVPFFRATLASTLIGVVLLFGGYEVLALRLRNTRLAPVLLT